MIIPISQIAQADTLSKHSETAQTKEIMMINDQQLMDQLDTAIQLMQGKITLEEAKAVLGELAGQSYYGMDFKPIVISGVGFRSDFGITHRMPEEEFNQHPERSEQYLRKATFKFEGWKHITKETLVERLKLPLKSEQYTDINIIQTDDYGVAPYCYYTYTIPKSTKSPYEVSVMLTFGDRGRFIRSDNKGGLFYHGAKDLVKVNISRYVTPSK